MKRCLVDVNVLLSVVMQRHIHHRAARQWYEGLQSGEGCVCRVAQLGLVRLLSNAAVMGEGVLTASDGWAVSEELLYDDRIAFAIEPKGIDSLMPSLFRYRTPTKNLITDAYLAAFAMAGSMKLATRDKGFHQFRGLDVELLS
jgi:hypothetical protein